MSEEAFHIMTQMDLRELFSSLVSLPDDQPAM